jgi:isoleucyl-tRNA synthetase
LKPTYLLLCKVLWPITPFLVEESWSYLDKNCFYQNEEIPLTNWSFEESVRVIEKALEVRKNLGAQISEINSWKLRVKIETSQENLEDLMVS